jgi:hypothetical protein
MSSAPFLSAILPDPELFIAKLVTDLEAANDEERAIRGSKAFKDGLPMAREDCPQRIWSTRAGSLERLPGVFLVNGYWIVSGEAADIMRRFDLGAGAFFPVEILLSDKSTPAPGSWFVWSIGNRKTAFREADSPAARAMAGVGRSLCLIPMMPKDDDIAVSPAALDGPEIWMDKTLFKSIFVSGPLGEALTAAGLAKAFRLFRCRLVD